MKNMNGFGFERIVGKTLNGGKYSDVYYYCGYNESCAKEDATHCIIYEKNQYGKVISKIHCKL